MATVSFFPRTKKGNSKIQARISIGRYKNFLISTKISVPEVEINWNFKKKMPRDPKRARFLETIRTKFLNHITDVELDLTKSLSDIKSEDFRRIVYDIHKVPEKERSFKKVKENSITDFIDSFLKKAKERGYRTKGNVLKQYTKGTLLKYEQLKSTIELFEDEEGVNCSLNSFNSKMVDLFDSFLTEHYAVSTAGRKLKSLKTILSKAYDEQHQVDPFFRSIKGYSYETTIVPLTEKEQEIIFATPMPDILMEYAKDYLLLLCGTGQRFSDVNAMTMDMVHDDVIRIKQKKTGNIAEIPIFDRVARILKKYNGLPPKFSDKEGSQNAHLNKMVKEVCKECGIDELLKESKNGKPGEYPKYELITTKTGRKSLATYLYKTLKWDAQSCMVVTGHKSLDSFFMYVGGKNTAITEANKERVSEVNKITVENRSRNMKIS